MELNGVPNDIIQNLNPISIIIFIRKSPLPATPPSTQNL